MFWGRKTRFHVEKLKLRSAYGIFADSRYFRLFSFFEVFGSFWICAVDLYALKHPKWPFSAYNELLGDFSRFWVRFFDFSSKISRLSGPEADFAVFVRFTLFAFFGGFLWWDWFDVCAKKSGKFFYIIHFRIFRYFDVLRSKKRDFTSNIQITFSLWDFHHSLNFRQYSFF